MTEIRRLNDALAAAAQSFESSSDASEPANDTLSSLNEQEIAELQSFLNTTSPDEPIIRDEIVIGLEQANQASETADDAVSFGPTPEVEAALVHIRSHPKGYKDSVYQELTQGNGEVITLDSLHAVLANPNSSEMARMAAEHILSGTDADGGFARDRLFKGDDKADWGDFKDWQDTSAYPVALSGSSENEYDMRQDALREVSRAPQEPPHTLQDLLNSGTPLEQAAAQKLIKSFGMSPNDQVPVLIEGTGQNDRILVNDTPEGDVSVKVNGTEVARVPANTAIIIDAGAGDDTLENWSALASVEQWGGAGNDDLRGTKGNDVLHGGSGDDMLRGLEGNDSFTGGAGADIILEGVGEDNIADAREEDIVVKDPLSGQNAHLSKGVDYSGPRAGVISASAQQRGEAFVDSHGQTLTPYTVSVETSAGSFSFEVQVDSKSNYANNADAVAKLFSQLPPEQLQVAGAMTGPIVLNSNAGGGYGWSSGLTIGSGQGSTESSVLHILNHELGHALQGISFGAAQTSQEGSSSFQATWSEAVKADYLANGGVSTTAYGETNAWEDHAEFTAMYSLALKDPNVMAELREKYPNRLAAHEQMMQALTPATS